MYKPYTKPKQNLEYNSLYQTYTKPQQTYRQNLYTIEYNIYRTSCITALYTNRDENPDTKPMQILTQTLHETLNTILHETLYTPYT